MTEEDDSFLIALNGKRDASNQCTEDQFEEVMHFFEETAQTKQPYAAVDSPPVLSFEEIQESMDAAVEQSVKHFAKDIYPHWKETRIGAGNQELTSNLKVCNPLRICSDFRADCHSSKRAKRPMIPIHMSASVGVKSARFARLAAEMRRVPTSCGGSEKSSKMPGSWLHWCGSANLHGRRCLLLNGMSSYSALR